MRPSTGCGDLRTGNPTSRSEVRRLADQQLANFDTDLMRDERWTAVRRLVACRARTRPLRLLDVGGGNGNFADKILASFPDSTVTIVDNSEFLLSQNERHQNKELVHATAEALDYASLGTFDIISFNWVLHHIVGETSKQTDLHVRRTLALATRALAADGHVSVFENPFEGVVVDGFPGRAIYEVTRLQRHGIATSLRRFGVNTAGVGVRFRSDRGWEAVFRDAGLVVEARTVCDTLRYPRVALIAAACHRVRTVHYQLGRAPGHTSWVSGRDRP